MTDIGKRCPQRQQRRQRRQTDCAGLGLQKQKQRHGEWWPQVVARPDQGLLPFSRSF